MGPSDARFIECDPQPPSKEPVGRKLLVNVSAISHVYWDEKNGDVNMQIVFHGHDKKDAWLVGNLKGDAARKARFLLTGEQ